MFSKKEIESQDNKDKKTNITFYLKGSTIEKIKKIKEEDNISLNKVVECMVKRLIGDE